MTDIPKKPWKELVKRFANGKTVCNCGHAYYSFTGRASLLENGEYKEITDFPICEYGCSTNQLRAKDEIAKQILALHPNKPATIQSGESDV